MDPSSPEVIHAAQVLTSRSAFALSTWPVGEHLVDGRDVTASLVYARKVPPGEIPEGAAVPPIQEGMEELDELARRGELFIDSRSGEMFSTDHVADPVYRLRADDFFIATDGRFGSLADFTEDLPDWAVPLGPGQTVRVGYSERPLDPRYKDILLGLDERGQATWVLTADQ